MNKEIEMSGEFDNEGNELTKAQAEFFKDSKVRDSQGRLLVVYHGTDKEFSTFSVGDIGYHFGTLEQASDRISSSDRNTSISRIIPVYLNIKHLMYVDTDFGDWEYIQFKEFLKGELLYDEWEIFDHRPFGRQLSNEQLKNEFHITIDDLSTIENISNNTEMRTFLLNKGIDGIEYYNDNEGYGDTSYIVFNSNQIKLITNKTPTDSDNINEDTLNESFIRLNEATKQQLITKTKNSDNYKDTSKGKNRYERRLRSRIANSVANYNRIDMDALFKRDILTIGIDVQGETNNYVVTIRFVGLLNELQREVKANNNKLEFKLIVKAMSRVFNSNDISLHCTCKDFQYRQSYNASKQNYGTQYEPRPSNITNPNDTKGGGCKHCMLVLANLDWVMKVSSVINNYIKYCQNNMEYNYANYIFPKVYGMPYKDAIQLSMFDNGGYLPSDQKTVGDIAKRNMSDKDEKGRFIKGNKFAFDKNPENRAKTTQPTQPQDEEEPTFEKEHNPNAGFRI